MNGICFEKVTKVYPGGSAPAVDDISLEVPAGSFVVFLGPSGCGKTTLLKMVNRLIEPSEGTICLDGSDIRDFEITTLRRRIGYVIQQVGLFPHMTVAQNIAVVPELVGWGDGKIRERTVELLALMRMPPDEYMDRYPAQLSGGQQQRVGIARALAADPNVMLMDEPFGAIDAITRSSLQQELCQLQHHLKKTILFVTHDVDEALLLADRIVVLREGRLVQYDTPFALLNHPANDFVLQLLNSDDRIRQISLLSVNNVMVPRLPSEPPADSPEVPHTANLRLALSLLLKPDVRAVRVTKDGQQAGWVTIEQLRSAGGSEAAA